MRLAANSLTAGTSTMADFLSAAMQHAGCAAMAPVPAPVEDIDDTIRFIPQAPRYGAAPPQAVAEYLAPTIDIEPGIAAAPAQQRARKHDDLARVGFHADATLVRWWFDAPRWHGDGPLPVYDVNQCGPWTTREVLRQHAPQRTHPFRSDGSAILLLAAGVLRGIFGDWSYLAPEHRHYLIDERSGILPKDVAETVRRQPYRMAGNSAQQRSGQLRLASHLFIAASLLASLPLADEKARAADLFFTAAGQLQTAGRLDAAAMAMELSAKVALDIAGDELAPPQRPVSPPISEVARLWLATLEQRFDLPSDLPRIHRGLKYAAAAGEWGFAESLLDVLWKSYDALGRHRDAGDSVLREVAARLLERQRLRAELTPDDYADIAPRLRTARRLWTTAAAPNRNALKALEWAVTSAQLEASAPAVRRSAAG